MKSRTWMMTLLLAASPMAAVADDKPAAGAEATQPAAQAKSDRPGASAKVKMMPRRRRVTAAEIAHSRAMLDAAIDAQGMQVARAEANRQAAVRAEQMQLQGQNLQQLDTIRRLTPQGTTVYRYGANGQLETNTYYFAPATQIPGWMPFQP